MPVLTCGLEEPEIAEFPQLFTMKHFQTFSLLSAVLLAATSPLPAQDVDPKNIVPAPDENAIVPEWQMAYENLKEEVRKKYSGHLYEASRLFNQKRVIESLNELAEAEKLFDQGPAALNLRGACYVEFRNFEGARTAFQKALELQQAYLKDITAVRGEERLRRMRPVINILFNLAEMDFVTGQWRQCHDRIEKLLPKLDPKNISMARLIEFKFLLCKLKLNQVGEARKLAAKYDYLDDNPFYYYANAAIAFFDDDTDAAERWRSSARRVFRRPQVLASWEDTLIEFGYVKSFYGGDLAEDE